MYPSDPNRQYANERYKAEVTAARVRSLIRAAQATNQPATQHTRAGTLIAHIIDALRLSRPAQA